MVDILLLMCKQTNEKFELKSVDPDSNKIRKKWYSLISSTDGIKTNSFIYDFPKGSAMLNTNENVIERDKIKGDENKVKQFRRDIGYKQSGDTKNNRSKIVGRIIVSVASPRRNCLREWRKTES